MYLSVVCVVLYITNEWTDFKYKICYAAIYGNFFVLIDNLKFWVTAIKKNQNYQFL